MGKVGAVLLTLSLIIINLLFLDDIFIKENAHWFYLVQFLYLTVVVFNYKKNYYYFFSPSYLTILYLGYSFVVGHFVVLNNMGLNSYYYDAFMRYKSYSFICNFFLLSNLIVFLAMPIMQINKTKNDDDTKKSSRGIPFLFALLILFAFFDINLEFLGGEGNFNYAFELGIAILLVNKISGLNAIKKITSYLFLIGVFVFFHYDSKREVFFLLILVIFFEIIRNRIVLKFSRKHIFVSFIFSLFAFYIILVASISRGYGNFNVENPIEALNYVDDYLELEIFQDALVNNLELATVYGNSSNAVNYIYADQMPLVFGSTLIKFLFLPVPRSIYPNKPNSMVDIYTKKFQPSFRAIGGSLPIIFYAEVFWNFHFVGLFILYFFYQFLNFFYQKVINAIKSNAMNFKIAIMIYFYITILQFIRGAGLELWIMYPLVSSPLLFILTFKLKEEF